MWYLGMWARHRLVRVLRQMEATTSMPCRARWAVPLWPCPTPAPRNIMNLTTTYLTCSKPPTNWNQHLHITRNQESSQLRYPHSTRFPSLHFQLYSLLRYVCVCAAVPNLVCQYAIKFCPQVTVKRFVTLLVGETTWITPGCYQVLTTSCLCH